jgi:SAM-dependent methyltransferase
MDRTPYSKLAEVYDLGWGDFAESCKAYIQSTLKEHGPEFGNVLDLACGTGTLAIHLARLGHAVLGVDRSPEMIAIARTKAQNVKGVDFTVADIREFSPSSGFDAVLCMFDSLNYLTSLADISASFSLISAILRNDGVFIFDFNRPLVYSAYDGETLRRRVEDGILRQELHYQAANRLARTVFRFPDGDVETHLQRAYELDEIEPLLGATGMSLCTCASDFDGGPVSSASERLICVGTKRQDGESR